LEARELAEGLLVNHPADPSVILILATIESADGRVEAARDHLRRVLYLSPDDLSALFQMAVLCESEGELDVADRFRRRMDRLASDGGFEK
jgi:Flp pilus assembly protein TadD